jgi:hypothetical protein
VVFAPGNRIEINLLIFSALNASADLFRSPSFARHLIGVESFLGAGAAFSAMQVLETAAQTGVPDGPVTAAVAGQLI